MSKERSSSEAGKFKSLEKEQTTPIIDSFRVALDPRRTTRRHIQTLFLDFASQLTKPVRNFFVYLFTREAPVYSITAPDRPPDKTALPFSFDVPLFILQATHP